MRRSRFSLGLVLGLLLTGCAGYQVGADALYPPDVRTVYVPMFESSSFRRHLGERLTEAVIKEIEGKTPFKVVNTPDADSILTGRIVLEAKRVVVKNPQDEPREAEVSFSVRVTWATRNDGMAERCIEVPLPPAVADVQQASTFLPEIGQSVATGHDEAVRRLAEQIVSMMEQPW